MDTPRRWPGLRRAFLAGGWYTFWKIFCAGLAGFVVAVVCLTCLMELGWFNSHPHNYYCSNNFERLEDGGGQKIAMAAARRDR